MQTTDRKVKLIVFYNRQCNQANYLLQLKEYYDSNQSNKSIPTSYKPSVRAVLRSIGHRLASSLLAFVNKNTRLMTVSVPYDKTSWWSDVYILANIKYKLAHFCSWLKQSVYSWQSKISKWLYKSVQQTRWYFNNGKLRSDIERKIWEKLTEWCSHLTAQV